MRRYLTLNPRCLINKLLITVFKIIFLNESTPSQYFAPKYINTQHQSSTHANRFIANGKMSATQSIMHFPIELLKFITHTFHISTHNQILPYRKISFCENLIAIYCHNSPPLCPSILKLFF